MYFVFHSVYGEIFALPISRYKSWRNAYKHIFRTTSYKRSDISYASIASIVNQ